MADLRIGTAAAGKRFTLPLAIGTQTSAIVGIRGSGKTVTATVIIEELLRSGHQVVVIDPTDAWFGLKSSADGSKAGFPVIILGGPHGDLPLEPGMGKAIPDFAVEQRVPIILSLRHLRKHQQQTFVTEFAEQLYHRKGEAAHRTPLLVAIDEASAFIPQRVAGPEARMVGAIEDLVRRGRSAGLGVMLIDQRPASVNKDVLTQLEVLVAHRVSSPQDSKALDDWIRQHDTAGGRDTFLGQLPSLPQGAAWFWSPTLDVFERVQVRMRETFDSSRTPKPGEHSDGPKAWAKVDLKALSTHLQDSIKGAEENDPKALRKRIQELERELARKPSKVVEKPSKEAIDVVVREATAPLELRVSEFELKIGRAAELAEQLAKLLRNGSAPPTAKTVSAPTEATTKVVVPPSPTKPRSAPLSVDLTSAQLRILGAVSTLTSLGNDHPSRPSVGALSGYSSTSGGTFAKNVAILVELGLLEIPEAGLLRITENGIAAAPEAERLRSKAEFHAKWLSLLSDAEARILSALIDVFPHALTRPDLGSRTGYSSTSGGTFAKNVAKLCEMRAAEIPRPGEVRASDLLFPKGLANA